MEIPNLLQGREKTVTVKTFVFQKYILYWSRLFSILVVTLGFYGVLEKFHLGMPEINTLILNGSTIND